MKPPKKMTMHEMRLAHYRKQAGCCWLCGEHIDLFRPVHSWGSPSWEHIIPMSHGGSERWSNVALTHWECNKARRDRFIWRLARPQAMKDFRPIDPVREQRFFDKQLLPRIRRLLLPVNGARTRYEPAGDSRSACTKESAHDVAAQVRAGWNPVRPAIIRASFNGSKA